MYQAADLPVTSIKSLISTIRTDKQVRRWFAHLISQQTVQGMLSKDNETEAAYRRLRNVSYQERIARFFLLGALSLAVITFQFRWGLLAAALFMVNIFLQMQKKGCVVKICSFLISKDFDKSLFAQNTLYQIGEFYSRKYNVAPLINAITSVDTVTRKAVFYTIIFTTLIYPLSFWQTWGSVLAAYYISYGLVSAAFIYNRTR